MAATTVTLDDAQLEFVRREAMKQTAHDLRNLADQLDELAIVAPWPERVLTSDAQCSRGLVLESLGTLDALGYPQAADEVER